MVHLRHICADCQQKVCSLIASCYLRFKLQERQVATVQGFRPFFLLIMLSFANANGLWSGGWLPVLQASIKYALS